VSYKSITGASAQICLGKLAPGEETLHAHAHEQLGIVLAGKVQMIRKLFLAAWLLPCLVAAGEFSEPWKEASAVLVIDAFAGNQLDWDKLWQFSSEIRRQLSIPGTGPDIDINVYNGTTERFKADWPLTRKEK
jgi:hypothetical protein